MTTAYTSLLGLALPVTGELSGTWGTTVNDAITSLLDSAVAGTTTLSTDADVTLTTTTGAANTSRQIILLCSGARTVLRTITAPAQSKIYTIINATTGGFSVKLVGVGPTTGVTIVAGESAVVAWNGSDFIRVANTSGPGTFTTLNCTTLTATADSTFSSTGAVTLSKGTTGQQPGSPVTGMLRYNTTTNQFEGYAGASPAWAGVGGASLSNDTSTASFEYPLFAAATSGSATTVYTSNAKLLYKPSTGEFQASELAASNGLVLNATNIAASYTIGTGYNAMSVGPVTVASGQSVTVSSGQRWLVF
jgi:hypothetical protein